MQGRRQIKQSGVDSMGGTWGGVSSQVGGSSGDTIESLGLSVHSTTTQSQKHPWKNGVDVTTPVHP